MTRLHTDGLRTLVQLPHPGYEHEASPGETRAWPPANERHRRTFLRSHATFRRDAEGPDERGDVAFWGEWEGAARAVAAVDPVPGGPRWLCVPEPRAEPPRTAPPPPPQNTDPFVWGDEFRYTFCRQEGNRKLKALGAGSVILFGSGFRDGFVLDTVLVVAGWADHTGATWQDDLEGLVTPAYARATLGPMYGWGSLHDTFRLYLGATPENPIDGMFSFVPAVPVTGDPRGFARPLLKLPQTVLSPKLNMGARVNADMAPDEVRKHWETVVEQVLHHKHHLMLATRLDLPA